MRTETPLQIKLEDYRPFPFAIDTVRLKFELHAQATLVHASLSVRRLSDGPLKLDGNGLELLSLKLDGQTMAATAYTITEEHLILQDTPDQFRLETIVRINPEQNTELSGLYISGGRFCTQCEATGFRRITYWPDRPDVMSRFHVRLEADRQNYPILLSNGTPGATGPLANNRHYAEWQDPHPKPSYLFALCGGDYDIHKDHFTTMSGKRVELAVHADKGAGPYAVWAMESLKAAMKWDEDIFGREYDLGVFNIVAVRDFNFGAMENKGLNIFNSAYVLADAKTATDADFEAIESIVGHEYFHNWTGNRITCRDWFQLCLKEGLTVFRDQEFSADMRSRPVQRIKDVIRLRGRQYTEDSGPLAHAVRPDSYASIDNLYTATVYEKGAELIRMLKTLIGDEAFTRGMQIYFDKYDGQATTIEHFYSCFEQASGLDLADFRLWYSQPGTPLIRMKEVWDEDAGNLTVSFHQTNPETPACKTPQPLPLPLRVAAFTRAGQKLEETVLKLQGEKHQWQISKLSERPLLSVNRGFSAPVRLDQPISSQDLLKLASIDDDPFNQWQALQTLLVEDLLKLASRDDTEPDAALIEAIADSMQRHRADPAFAALLLRLPDTGELMMSQTPAQPDRLAQARSRFQTRLAEALYTDIQQVLSAPSPAPFYPDAEQGGVRALRSACLNLLGSSQNVHHHSGLKAQFDAAENMTESLASLRALCASNHADKSSALQAFYTQWSDSPLVLDKWFAVQAETGTAEMVDTLLAHEKFDYTNPNRVRALIGLFAMRNLAAFHKADGSGYALLCKVIKKVDPLNSALSARLLTAFEQWRSLHTDTQQKALDALERMQKLSLSKPAQDILHRTLG